MAPTFKPWEELTISDNYMFQLVMREPKLCKYLLEKLLQIEIQEIKFLDNEKTLDAGLDHKSIRLDVYVKDEAGRRMQYMLFTQEIQWMKEDSFAEGEAKGMAKGMEKGKAEGKAEEKLEAAQKLLQLGVPVETIAAGTGLPLEEVQKMAKKK